MQLRTILFTPRRWADRTPAVKGPDKSMQVHGSGKPDKEYMIYVVDNETSYEGYSKEYKINKNGGSGSLLVMKAGTRDETQATFEFTCN